MLVNAALLQMVGGAVLLGGPEGARAHLSDAPCFPSQSLPVHCLPPVVQVSMA